MWKFLATLCIALTFISAEKTKNRISGIPYLAPYQKVPHHQPKYRAILSKALTSVNVDPTGLVVLSLYKKNEGYKSTYKVTYENDNGETCFMKWKVLAVLKTSDPELPSCTKPDKEFDRRSVTSKSTKKSEHNKSKKDNKKKQKTTESKKTKPQNRSKHGTKKSEQKKNKNKSKKKQG